MERHTAAWWAKRVAELARGGNPGAIARRHGVSERTLIWWRAELRKRAKAAPRLLPVTVTEFVAPAKAEPDGLEVVVEIGVARVTLRGAVTAEHLGVLVAAARAC